MKQTKFDEFMQSYKRDTEEFRSRFSELDTRLQRMDQKFHSLDRSMEKLDKKLSTLEDVYHRILSGIGGVHGKMENLRVFLTTVETKLHAYETLHLLGEKRIDGDLFLLKIELQKVKSIIHWENDSMLLQQYNSVEERFSALLEQSESA